MLRHRRPHGVPVVAQVAGVLGQVLPDAERAPAPGQQHGPHRVVLGERGEGVAQRDLELGVEGVHRVRPVQGHGRDGVGGLEAQDVGHGSPPGWGVARSGCQRQAAVDEAGRPRPQPLALASRRTRPTSRRASRRAAATGAGPGPGTGTCATRGPAASGWRRPSRRRAPAPPPRRGTPRPRAIGRTPGPVPRRPTPGGPGRSSRRRGGR